MFFGIVESKACEWVGILLPVLDTTLGKIHMRPKRAKGRSLEEIIEEFPELKELGVLIDGTERPISRPKDEEEQKEHYSEKCEAAYQQAWDSHPPQDTTHFSCE
jgi:hypothetical protein